MQDLINNEKKRIIMAVSRLFWILFLQILPYILFYMHGPAILHCFSVRYISQNYSNSKCFSHTSIRSLAEIADHIGRIKRRCDGIFFWNALMNIFSLVVVVIKGLMIWGSKCHQNNSPVVCDACYVKHEEAKVDSLVAILKTNNCGGGPCGMQ